MHFDTDYFFMIQLRETLPQLFSNKLNGAAKLSHLLDDEFQSHSITIHLHFDDIKLLYAPLISHIYYIAILFFNEDFIF